AGPLQERHALNRAGKVDLFPVQVDPLVSTRWLGGVGLAGQDAWTFAVKVQASGEVDDEREVLRNFWERCGDQHLSSQWQDRQVDAEHAADLGGEGTGGIHECLRFNRSC